HNFIAGRAPLPDQGIGLVPVVSRPGVGIVANGDHSPIAIDLDKACRATAQKAKTSGSNYPHTPPAPAHGLPPFPDFPRFFPLKWRGFIPSPGAAVLANITLPRYQTADSPGPALPAPALFPLLLVRGAQINGQVRDRPRSGLLSLKPSCRSWNSETVHPNPC